MSGVERLRIEWRRLRGKEPGTAPETDTVSRRRRERVRFGPFEADLHTHELWRDGTRIKLAGQPFVVLEMLLQSPGHLITRDELRASLWPSDTFVSFDHGLNAAVNRLRQALGDSATDPRYIETLPRRGYRDFLNAALYDQPRFAAIAFAACASRGFILAIIGLFSVMTYIVSLKTHDIGIRLALGASREAILQLVMRRGFVVIITGVVIGVAASLVLTRFVASQLTGVSATDPLTFVGVVLTVMLAGLFACFLPARRATLVEPMATLRNE